MDNFSNQIALTSFSFDGNDCSDPRLLPAMYYVQMLRTASKAFGSLMSLSNQFASDRQQLKFTKKMHRIALIYFVSFANVTFNSIEMKWNRFRQRMNPANDELNLCTECSFEMLIIASFVCQILTFDALSRRHTTPRHVQNSAMNEQHDFLQPFQQLNYTVWILICDVSRKWKHVAESTLIGVKGN